MSRSEAGFTIIELLVVVATISVLAAIALPQFAEYREKGHDREAQSTLRAIATAQEAYFLENDSYISCNQGNCHTFLDGIDPVSSDVTVSITSTGTEFTGTALHNNGTGEVFNWP